ncbi:MAG TPA: FG-GAP-like repeat-containing protein [Flavobacteriales bacterium]|nr:FG-GAP-like repeat-containing protein [Flavobacteriales bacterium]HMR26169.1 FG-GAP-like repeat-containing protein [Flavobacteriales bacterium]
MDDGARVWTNAQGLMAHVRPDGVVLSPAEEDTISWTVALLLHRIGRAEDWSAPIEEPEMERTQKRVLARHGRFDLEQVNSDAGVRQNFIVHHRSKGEGPLRVELTVEGDLRCAHAGGDRFAFSDTAGTVRMHYNDLHVWDAQGDTLQASAAWEDERIVLLVNDAGAAYPITIDPLSTTAVWSTESNLANARLGTSLSSAGDVNGDGYSDILVGVPVWSNGQTGEGRVQLHYGSATGPSAAISWSFETNQLGANLGLGNSVATAGDVNGDGYSDIIVGAPYFDNGQTDEGRVYVFHGSATGLSATPDWTAEIDQANALFGFSVNCAGDVNGDGFSDVVVGAYQYSNGNVNEGGVFVYHGSATGLSATPNWTAEGNQTTAYFGRCVASAGDVNGDGFSDLIVGAPLFDNGQTNEGRAFIYHGSATGLAATAARTIESNQASSQTGYAVSSAGDVNNDGYTDVAVGIPFYTSSFANDGRVVIHLGSAAGVAAAPAWTYDSPNNEAQLGKALACAGDANGDGFSDLIVGAPEHTIGEAQEGRIYTFFGNATTAMSLDWQVESNQAGARQGTAVAGAGDVNGDGFSDVLVGIPEWDNGQSNEGRARVYMGSAGSLTPAGPQIVTGSGGIYAHSVAAAGDVNGDGRSDVIVGAEDHLGVGSAYLHLGNTTGIDPAAINTWTGTVGGMKLGARVAGAGDVNGDGYSDVIIGAPAAGIGRAYIHHGSTAGASATPNTTLLGTVANTRFGATLASAGDVNGDGYSDVIVGEPQWNSAAGAAYVYHGGPAGINPVPAWTVKPFDTPFVANANFGQSVAGAGDVNGDGYSDVIVGAGGYNGARGRVFVYHGGPSGLSTTPTWTFDGVNPNQRLGSDPHSENQVSSLGDVNGDGYGDVAISAMKWLVHVFHGSPTGLGPAPAWTDGSPSPGDFFGVTATSAGDVNGDGYSDMIIANCNQGVWLYLGRPSGFIPAPDVQLGALSAPGHSSAGVGDVDGDGYSDIVAGRYTNSTLALFRGNANATSSRQNLRLYNTDLVSPISASNIPDPQFGAGLYTRPFLGRVKHRIAWETRIQGVPFSSAAGSITTSTAFTEEEPVFTMGPVAGQERKVLVDKLGGGAGGITAHKVRVRVRYDPVTAITGQVYGPWRYMPGYMNGHGTHTNVPLPVELLRFDAACRSGVVELTWVTASETNSGHFTVERSPDGEVWSEVALVQAAGHSQHPMEYGHHDGTPPNTPELYYRLRLTDLDGTDAVLMVTPIAPCASATVRIHPNPSSGLVAIDLSAFAGAARSVQLFDQNGQSVLTVPVNGPSTTLDLGPLPAATYLLRVLNEAGDALATERLVKQ